MSFTIQLQPSGHTVTADPGEVVLDAALRQRAPLPYGCRNGACGSCKARLIDGRYEYANPPHDGALTGAEREAGYILLCQARARSDMQLRVQEFSTAADIRVRTLPARVVKKWRLAHDVMGLQLKLPDSERLQYLAGQYIDILLRDGKRRAFSLANAPQDDSFLELHIRHIPDGAYSHFVFTEMPEKALLRIRGPLGNFYLRDDNRPAILIGGGTGFAPLKAMIEASIIEQHHRPLHLYCGVRAKRDLYMHDWALDWVARYPHIHYKPVLSEPHGDDHWDGATGFVHEAVLDDFGDLSGFQIYASGPPVMVHAAAEAFVARGVSMDDMFSDAFDYAYETGHDG